MSYSGSASASGGGGGGGVTSLTGDTGGALAGALNLVGAGAISVGGAGSTLTIAIAGAALSSRFVSYMGANQVNVTGDGTDFFPICSTVLLNTGANYDSTTGIYTAPTTGAYLFTYSIAVDNLSGANTEMNAYISLSSAITAGGRYLINPGSVRTSTNQYFISGSGIVYMNAGDTARPGVQVSGGAKTITIQGEATYATSFSGVSL